MKKRGFTLIELLAVIVILGLIALMTVPVVMRTISDSEKKTMRNSGYGLVEAAKIYHGMYMIEDFSGAEKTFTFPNNIENLDIKGDVPTSGSMTIDSNGNVSIQAIYKNKWCVSKARLQDTVNVSNNLSTCGIEVVTEPVIKEGMIPVEFDASGNTVKANVKGTWYDYESKKWANAVVVTSASRSKYLSASAGTQITESDILGYFVWVPRYKYKLFNASNGTVAAKSIEIQFESASTTKSTGTTNGTWLTHPAFTFGSTVLAGIWVGKFELTGDATTPTVKPNQKSLTNQNIATAFNTIRKFSTTSNYGLTTYDAHMMKNSEWGAVAYLSHSVYGKNSEVWINNVNTGYGNGEVVSGLLPWGPSITGCSGASASAGVQNNMTACASGYDYKQKGVNASTTGNITGIYDMSGGAWEYVMGSVLDSSGNFVASSAGFTTKPDSKYYDAYPYNTDSNNYAIGKLGDATRETLVRTSGCGWYSDETYMPGNTSYCANCMWFDRGGDASNGSNAGLFSFYRGIGVAFTSHGSRAVVVAVS